MIRDLMAQKKDGGPGEIRTPDPRLIRAVQ